MAIKFQESPFPLPAGYPLPSGYGPADIDFWARQYADDAWSFVEPSRPIALYFHGSGSTEPISGPLVDGLIAEGYFVVAVMDLGVWKSSPDPYRYGYGNVNAPHFMSHFIKGAWWVDAYISLLESAGQPRTITIIGHSMGAAAALAWGAGYTGRKTFPSWVKGIVSSGATVAGLGDLSWNDVNRNINTLSGIVSQLKVKTIMAYGDNDAYGPPDYARHLQMAIPEGADTYVVSPGDAGHDWTNSAEYSHFAVQWVKQIMTDQPITDRLGNPAVAGSVIP